MPRHRRNNFCLLVSKRLYFMKKIYTIGIASTVIAAGLVAYAYFVIQKDASQKKLDSVADAGYETAYDVLYPLKTSRFRRS